MDLTWLRMEFRLRARAPVAVALPSEAVARRRGHAVPAARVAVLPASLHGALGARLRRLTCADRRPVCPDCPPDCLFARTFRPPGTVPPPVRLELPPMRTLPNVLLPEQEVELALLLIGPAAIHALAFRQAMIEAGEIGFGEPGLFGLAERQSFEIAESRFFPSTLEPSPPPGRVRLAFVSPWVARHGRYDAAGLMATLRARLDRGLDARYGSGQRAALTYPPTDGLRLRWLAKGEETWSAHYDPFRPRARPAQYVRGRVGTAELEGDLAPYWDLLRLGEALGLGSRTPLGFGRYVLSPRLGGPSEMAAASREAAAISPTGL